MTRQIRANRPGSLVVGYVLVAFAVYLGLTGVLVASAPWWGAAGVIGCLLWIAVAAAPEAGRMLAESAAVLAREPDEADGWA